MTRSICVFNEAAAAYADAISAQCDDFTPVACATRDQTRSSLATAEVLMLMDAHVDDELLALAVNLRWIHALTSGTDKIVGSKALRPDVVVTSSSGTHGTPMSEHALCMMLALVRDLPRTLTNQRNAVWDRWPSPSLSGKTVCLVGMGSSSSAIARKCKAFGMRVLGVSSTRRAAEHYDHVFVRDELHAAVFEADFVVTLVPLTRETLHLIDAGVFQSMRTGSWFINLARGSVVDESALIKCLEAGRLRGAALDVFEVEPLPEQSLLWTMPNVILTPHIAGAAQNYVELMTPLLLDNLSCYRDGKKLRNVVRGAAPT